MTELASLVLRVRPRHQDTVPRWLGRAWQACFLASLRRINPALSAAIHDGSQLKPFTASNLLHDGRGELVDLHPQRTYDLRVTSLHPDLTQIVTNGLVPMWLDEGITLHDQPLRVEAISTDPTGETWAGATTYADLRGQHTTINPRPARQIRLHFASPTCFKKTGQQMIPFPLPSYVFNSLIDRWNAFAGSELSPELREFVEEHVTVSDYNTHTRRISFERSGRGAVTGFVGHVTYAVGLPGDTLAQQVHMLAAYALYSGVGARTTMGLGQARVVSAERRSGAA